MARWCLGGLLGLALAAVALGQAPEAPVRRAFDGAAAGPTGSFSLRVVPAVALEAGQETLFAVHLLRERFTEPVALTFEGLPPHVTVSPEATVSGDRASWQGMLRATAEATPGTTSAKVRARAAGLHKEAAFQLTVVKGTGPP